MSLSGKCLCSAVSYTCDVVPLFSGNCHCEDCKKASGSGYAPTMFFPENTVTIRGDVTYFSSEGCSGNNVRRGFCPNCGSQLFGKPELMPGLLGIRAGSLDDISQYKPQSDLFTSHCVAWDVMDEATEKFPEMPPRP